MSRKFIYQLFCGRMPEENVLEHRGKVLHKMSQGFPWQKIRDDGFDIVYLLGLWDTTGPVVVGEEQGVDIREFKHRRPSPFSITNHTQPNPDLGTEDDLIQLVRKIKESGLKVVVDFVPNHTGKAHDWIQTRPEYYKNINADAFSGDVIELNYENPELRAEMTQVLLKLSSYGIDGFRCDMAHLIPSGFWQEALATVRKKYLNSIFIAEAYGNSVFDLSPQRELIKAGFNAVYDEPLYRNLKQVSGMAGLDAVVGHLKYIATTDDKDSWVHYCANHDDSFPLTKKYLILWQILFLCLPGYHLVYNGFWQGQTKRLAHHWTELLPQEHLPDGETDLRLLRFVKWLKEDKPVLKQINLNQTELELDMETREDQFRIAINFEKNLWQVCRGNVE